MSNEIHTYVPSDQAVEAADSAIRSLLPTRPMPGVLGSAALTAAVPVEVAREVARLLGEVRALAESAREDWRIHEAVMSMPKGHRPCESKARLRFAEKVERAVLDTVGEPAPALELFPGTRDQLGALGIRPTGDDS